MSLIELVFISLGLASDTFAVSLCKGVFIKDHLVIKNIKISFYFAVVQVIMTFLGFIVGNSLSRYVSFIDHWIACIILSLIGFNMLYEIYIGDSKVVNDKIDFKSLFLPAIATSIDALALGITFSFFNINIIFTLLVIGIITFIMSFIGIIIGYYFGRKFEFYSKIFGGFVLIIMGFKILIEHMV